MRLKLNVSISVVVLFAPAQSEDVGECKEGEWRCGDRSCAGVGAACDGALQCADGSDEALLLCRGTERPLLGLVLLCQEAAQAHPALCPEACRRWPHYCYYAMMAEHGAPGTCILPLFPSVGSYSIADVTARGAGAADFTLAYSCPEEYRLVGGNPRCAGSVWTAGFPTCIPVSSPAVSAAFGKHCSEEQFSCADGACVVRERRCDGVPDCADGSDERACAADPTSELCVLPEYPRHGTYSVTGHPLAAPGQALATGMLVVTCDPGFKVMGGSYPYCTDGAWSTDEMPQCSRLCKLTPHKSVHYYCKETGEHQLSGIRSCEEYEPSGTVVVPECKRYYYIGVPLNMRCVDGSWDHVAICQPECGTSTPKGEQLIINGSRAERGELPWHAGIYHKGYTPYKQICGGSLVSTTVVISAAHCFWSEVDGLQSYKNYAVALGKIYRQWNDSKDLGVHKSDVIDIRVPVRYMGERFNYQEDIALVIMSTPVVYVTYIRPVCINFDIDFDKRQLQSSNSGKVVGWGLTDENGLRGSPVLQTAELPYVDVEKCIADLPFSFRSHITSDKICAGNLNGITICPGDSGGGLVFPTVDGRGTQRYYLRGVVSTAAPFEHRCDVKSHILFTHVLMHEEFIKTYLNSDM